MRVLQIVQQGRHPGCAKFNERHPQAREALEQAMGYERAALSCTARPFCSIMMKGTA